MSRFLSGRTSLTTVQTGDIEALAVTLAKIANNAVDETKLKDALIGDFTEVTAAAGDSILLGDADDSGNTKRDTVQGILDLASGGSFTFLSTVVASTDATITLTGLDSGSYDALLIQGVNLEPTTNYPFMQCRFGDSGGIDSGASDYAWALEGGVGNSTSWADGGAEDNADDCIQLGENNSLKTGTVHAASHCHFSLWLSRGDGSSKYPQVYGVVGGVQHDGYPWYGTVTGARLSAISFDRFQCLFSGGNILTGRLTAYGVNYA